MTRAPRGRYACRMATTVGEALRAATKRLAAEG